MERGKRASMREGPLAALFRKTEEEGVEPGREPAATPPPAPEPPAPEREEPVAGTDAEGVGQPAPAPREPRERLRHVFSSEIPENILDRESAPVREPEPVAPPPPAPVAREEAGPYAAPRPVGSPALR